MWTVAKKLKEKVDKLFGNRRIQNEWNRVLEGEVIPTLCEYVRTYVRRLYEKAVREKKETETR